MMTSITRWVLAHRRIVTVAWIAITLVGIATVGKSTGAFSKKFSNPGREGFVTNSRIQSLYHQGGRNAALVPVVSLSADQSVSSPAVRRGLLAVESRLRAAIPGSRTASYADTGNRAFVSADGRTTFVLAYPPPSNESFGNDTKAAKRAGAALAGATVAGAPVQLTGIGAMQTAGRAVVFSGTTVAIGLLAMLVLPLPFLRSIGYAGMLIPLVSVIVAVTLLPIVLLKAGNRLDWPHVRNDDQASRSWTGWARAVVRRRWVAAAGAALILAALVVAATSLQPGTPNLNTLTNSGQAHSGLLALERAGIGEGALEPIEILSPAAQAPRVLSTTRAVRGVHGAFTVQSPAWQRLG